jgi:hypothetical protein
MSEIKVHEPNVMLNSIIECIKNQQERGGVELGYALYELYNYYPSTGQEINNIEVKFERDIEFYKKLKEGKLELLGFSFTSVGPRPKVVIKED